MRIRRFVPLALCCLLVAGLVAVAAPASGASQYSIEQILMPRPYSHFGYAVDISGDTAIVGQTHYSADGQAIVYVRVGDTWVYQQTLDPPDVSVDFFGAAVAIDGDTIVVGAPHYDAANKGTAYVYVRSGDVWALQQQLALTLNAGDQFGSSVAIDGDWIVVGAQAADLPEDSPTITDAGSASIFHRVGTTWTREQLLTSDTPVSEEHFGSGVAIDNGIIAVGAPYATVDTNVQQGKTHYWTWTGTTWTYGGSFSVGGVYCYHGQFMALSNGTLIERGAGGPWVWNFNGASWQSQGRLRPADTPAGFYGTALDICGDTAIVGYADKDVGTNALQGAAYLFTRSGTTWTERKTFTASDGEANDNFGQAVAIGPTAAVVGAIGVDSNSGAAYFYSTPATVLTPVHRFYRPAMNTHFYTADEAEKANVIATLSGTFTYEGVAYGVNPAVGTQSLWRFYNKRTGTHFYTANDGERDSVNANLGYIYTFEGPAYNVSAGPITNALTVYRFYNIRNGTHFYTADEAERDNVRNTLGSIYQYEGPAFWVGQ